MSDFCEATNDVSMEQLTKKMKDLKLLRRYVRLHNNDGHISDDVCDCLTKNKAMICNMIALVEAEILHCQNSCECGETVNLRRAETLLEYNPFHTDLLHLSRIKTNLSAVGCPTYRKVFEITKEQEEEKDQLFALAWCPNDSTDKRPPSHLTWI